MFMTKQEIYCKMNRWTKLIVCICLTVWTLRFIFWKEFGKTESALTASGRWAYSGSFLPSYGWSLHCYFVGHCIDVLSKIQNKTLCSERSVCFNCRAFSLIVRILIHSTDSPEIGRFSLQFPDVCSYKARSRVPATIKRHPARDFTVSFSPSKAAARSTVMTILSLSMDTTLDVSPICSAL